MRVRACGHLCSRIMYYNKNFLSSSNIIAGHDDTEGFQIYAQTMGGAFVGDIKYYCCGSGGTYISAYLAANYRENMTYEEAKNLVINSIQFFC